MRRLSSASACVEIRSIYAHPLLAGGCLVLRNQVGGHATAVLNVVPVLARPVPDLGRVQRRASPPDCPTCNATAATRGPTHLTGAGDVLSERRPELLGVLRVQVALVLSAVEREPYGAFCRPAVNVVYEECRDLLGHL